MVRVVSVSAFSDNLIWLILLNSNELVIVDPGLADPVMAFLEQHTMRPVAILITHHHSDHIGGVSAITQRYPCPVYGPSRPELSCVTHAIQGGELLAFGEYTLQSLTTPGHTQDHICFYNDKHLFCGDTLFAGGCGRLFEGSPKDMLQSLNTLAKLPPDTAVYCAHEYTLANLNFATTIEPNNKILAARLKQTQHLRAQNLCTLPSSIGTEIDTNPFLRCHLPEIQYQLSQLSGQSCHEPLATFTALRQLKDVWRPS